MPRRELSVGLAGLGLHGERYANHLLQGHVPGARLVAVCRRRPDLSRAWAREHSLRLYGSFEELAEAPGLDALVAVLPPSQHAPAIATAAAAGRPLLVEKPAAAGADAARQALTAARRAGIPVMVAQTLRFDATITALAEALPSIGTIQTLAINQRFEPTTRDWIDRPGEGGLVFNTGVHGIDLMQYFTGCRITEARALAWRIHTRNTEDLFVAALRLEPGGILATLDNSRACGARSGRVEIAGTQGQLVADHVHGILWRLRGRSREALPVGPPVATCRAVLAAFADALRDGRPMPVPLAEGVAAVEGAQLVQQALDQEEQANP
ncbi:MAG: Gfo/Idh/MocA family oxidoreductase [Acidobacteriota bacterium]|nr:Gfo/Idh/MocA family oxidoreductase [Acidobacteriota bacterium]